MNYTPNFINNSDQKVIKIFLDYLDSVTQKAERLFAILFVFQWVMGIFFAALISPKTWSGEYSQVHIHVYAAILLGGVIASFPLFMIYVHPGKPITRHVIAFSQMLVAALLIHLTGGRIETHFHIFGSLAFIAFFRDWRIIATATTVVALDHLLRGIFWPQSVYGVLTAAPWRSLEHVAWVVFEDIVLLYSIRLALREAARVAEKEKQLSDTIANIEGVVTERTHELKELQKVSVQSAHQAGMSEIATGVLHNVGNVLNSANVGLETIIQKFDKSITANLSKANELLSQNRLRLGEFFTQDPKGEKLVNFYLDLGDAVKTEIAAQKNEAIELMKKLQLIKDIINSQQTYAKGSAEFKEPVNLVDILESALVMQANVLTRHEIKIVKKYSQTSSILVQKTKLIHVVLNLIKNAKEALDANSTSVKILTIEVGQTKEGKPFLRVCDTGEGIKVDSLSKIFSHGFTTKQAGHGFGLHFCANSITEMGGCISATSAGPGQGSQFTIVFNNEVNIIQKESA
jgi:two-component system sensor histidine kinase HydH